MEQDTSLSLTLTPASIMVKSEYLSPETCLKMQDFEIPPDQLSVTKPVKKRKSWGQELPEPKTALPPRKRAKTDDEKEQRRIERIQRNRKAAHMSRERKREEAAFLYVQNKELVKKMKMLQRQMIRQERQLARCREILPGGLPEVDDADLDQLEPNEDDDDESEKSPSSSYTTDVRASQASTPPTTPGDFHPIKTEAESPSFLSMPPPATFEAMAFPHLDMTQHSAVMLCDLQCQSSKGSNPSLQSTLLAWWWTQFFLYMMHINVMTAYKSLLMSFWTHFPAHVTRRTTSTLTNSSTSTLLSKRRHQTPSSLIMHPTWATLAQLFLATGQRPLGTSAQALTHVQMKSTSVDVRSERFEVATEGHWVDDGDGQCTSRTRTSDSGYETDEGRSDSVLPPE